LLGGSTVQAADGRLEWAREAVGTGLCVRGDADDDWFIEESSDLREWTRIVTEAPLLGGGSQAPILAVPPQANGLRFFRALKTDGIFDDTLVRTLSLTFTQANWQTRLTTSRTTGSNTLGSLKIDNGATAAAIGARYKGNSSFSGMGSGGAPTKKSINIAIDEVDPKADLMGYETLNLNNAYGDETILREALYFNVMRRYTVCPRATLARVFINDANWGVYSFVQQQDGDLIDEWFPSSNGDRWRAPNIGGGTGGAPGGGTGGFPGGPPGAGGGGGGFTSAASALSYLGADVSSYRNNYELKKSDDSTNAWLRLVHVIDVLNNTPATTFSETIDEVMAVDRWLWFLAVENVFADDDSYFNKGADYAMYFEPESGRMHPVEHDGNESFVAGDVQLSPVQGTSGTNRPVIAKLLGVAEYRQRYLAHMRTILSESFQPDALFPLIDRYHTQSVAHIIADPKKSYTMTAYTNDLNALKAFIRQRHTYLTNHAELRPVGPDIRELNPPTYAPTATESPTITTKVLERAGQGIDSVWLYFRAKSYGRFTAIRMHDDGVHGDGEASDGVFGAATAPFPAGTKVRFYVEARSANATKTATFFPARAEQQTQSYRVAVTTAASSPVVISELMASNVASITDPQGDFDDWVELHNITDTEVDLTGRYLTDEPQNPRKWSFPNGTKIPAGGYLIVWCDEDGRAPTGLHASFKLSANGEQIDLTETDALLNAILDSVTFGPQADDRSYFRSAQDEDVWVSGPPTPAAPNR